MIELALLLVMLTLFVLIIRESVTINNEEVSLQTWMSENSI